MKLSHQTSVGQRGPFGRHAPIAIVVLSLAVLPFLSGPGGRVRAAGAAMELRATPIVRFESGSAATRFGALEYVGGFRYAGSDARLRGVSSIRLSPDRNAFLAVTDTGFWFSGGIRRDADGAPIGIVDPVLSPILGAEGEARTRRKGDADAEGLAIDDGRVLVSYERSPRIEAFALPGRLADIAESRPDAIPQPIPRRELRSNAGIETIAVSPDGRVVLVTEQSVDEDGNLFAAILGEAGGLFKVKRDKPWSVTDGAFLAGGDLLLLERRYEGFGRVGMRIRRIAGKTIAVGATVDGDVLMEADLGQEIDNLEGLDASVGADGSTYLTLVSDDNGSFFQRNLFLEFRLTDSTAEAPSN